MNSRSLPITEAGLSASSLWAARRSHSAPESPAGPGVEMVRRASLVEVALPSLTTVVPAAGGVGVVTSFWRAAWARSH
jgi:hypothetical protein